MSSRVLAICLLLLGSSHSALHTDQHEVIVRNVVVPLRVFDGDRFVDDLTKDDVTLFEDGELQKILALYLTRDSKIARTEAERDFLPYVGRHIYLLFQTTEYNPKITEALDYFFTQMYIPSDYVYVMTPYKNYTMDPVVAKSMPDEAKSRYMQEVIRRDTALGAAEYNSLMRDLKKLARSLTRVGTGGLSATTITEFETDRNWTQFSVDLARYSQTLSQLEELRLVDEKRILQFAYGLKRLEGQKLVFLFYQREYRPEIPATTLSKLMGLYQDNPGITGRLQDLFQSYHRDLNLDSQKLQEVFADASILLSLLFIDKKPQHFSGISMKEQSEDLFKIFSELAVATGGIIDSSQNPAAAFKNVYDITQSYYLLYYSPQNYTRDGKFKNIEVRIKDSKYTVLYRKGYFAD